MLVCLGRAKVRHFANQEWAYGKYSVQADRPTPEQARVRDPCTKLYTPAPLPPLTLVPSGRYDVDTVNLGTR